jgi:hemolysin activation/secretion protein
MGETMAVMSTGYRSSISPRPAHFFPLLRFKPIGLQLIAATPIGLLLLLFLPSSLLAEMAQPPDSLAQPLAQGADIPGIEAIPSVESARPFRSIRVTGSTVFGEADFVAILKPAIGVARTLADLQPLAEQITQRYLDRGYLTSKAIPSDPGPDGSAEIRVIEGTIVKTELEWLSPSRKLTPRYVLSRLALGIGKPFNLNALEDQLKLLRADPLLASIEASLQPSGTLGQSNLVVRIREAGHWSSNLSLDNFSPPNVGDTRLGVTLGYRNLTGIGDEAVGSYFISQSQGAKLLDLSYRIPLNPRNGTLQLRFSPNWTKVTDGPFSALGIRGTSQLYEIGYRQPLIRNPREEFAFSAAFAYQTGQTFLFDTVAFPFGIGPDENGISRTSVVQFGQDYLRRDPGGSWMLRSRLSLGTSLFNATNNPEPIPDGQFIAWLGQAQRVQQLSRNQTLLVQGDLQLTPNSLLPAQQFTLGGGPLLRGYRQNARSGDNGFRLSIEDRISLVRNEGGTPTLQLIPFLDLGKVWNRSGNPNPEARQRFLAGTGVGLLWEPAFEVKGFSIQLDYAVPLTRLDDRGSNLQDQALYFKFNYRP